jgi:integrase/recombinase XerC
LRRTVPTLWRGCGRRSWPRVRGKAGRERIVGIGFQAARSLDRYLRVRARHPEAARPQLWLGVGGWGPLTPNGIY